MTNYKRIINIDNLAEIISKVNELADASCLSMQAKNLGVCPYDVNGDGPEHLERCLECNKEWLMEEESINNETC